MNKDVISGRITSYEKCQLTFQADSEEKKGSIKAVQSFAFRGAE